MNLFISYAQQDRRFAERLSEDLRTHKYNVRLDTQELKVGDNLIEKIESGLQEADYIIVVLSQASTQSAWVQKEFSIFGMREISRNQRSILPVLIEDCEIPGYIRDRVYIDFRRSYDDGLRHLIEGIRQISSAAPKKSDTVAASRENKEAVAGLQIRQIQNALKEGELSLFCGAGISIDAGVPPWGTLLRRLIGDLLRAGVLSATTSPNLKDELAAFYQDYFNPSSLMIAQYLKNGLGNDFLSSVRTALYTSNPQTCYAVDTIIELCRPQRSRKPLHSIVTYNFDDLIESNLEKHSIKHKPIFKEGQRNSAQELPVYHVHGYLPRQETLTQDHEIVFSEDAYHAHFIDPFSWANLVQLNHLNNNTCLFVGLSMTDPNLRRLLDVSMRKNPSRRLSHYVFRRRYDRQQISEEMKAIGIKNSRDSQAEAFARGQELLEEQDSKNLGLNVIWVDDFAEIPLFLQRVVTE